MNTIQHSRSQIDAWRSRTEAIVYNSEEKEIIDLNKEVKLMRIENNTQKDVNEEREREKTATEIATSEAYWITW